MQRYMIYAEGDRHECELEIVESDNGEWVRYEDVQELIKNKDTKTTNKKETK